MSCGINDDAGTFRDRSGGSRCHCHPRCLHRKDTTDTSIDHCDLQAPTSRVRPVGEVEKHMRKSKRSRLEAEGWTVGSVKEFLGLSEADAVLIE